MAHDDHSGAVASSAAESGLVEEQRRVTDFFCFSRRESETSGEGRAGATEAEGMHALVCVISGGQSGADRAGLEAARIVGVQTGGTAPSGFATSEGAKLDLGTVYGLKELPAARTRVGDRCTVRSAIHGERG